MGVYTTSEFPHSDLTTPSLSMKLDVSSKSSPTPHSLLTLTRAAQPNPFERDMSYDVDLVMELMRPGVGTGGAGSGECWVLYKGSTSEA